jgi:hypothetical protein
MQFGVRSNSAARSVSDFIAAHFTHSGHFCTAATFGSLRNCKVPRPSSWRAMRTASSSLAQSVARYRALHRTTDSSLSGCSRYQEPLQELRSIACATKRPISAARRREGGWQALQVWYLRCAIELGRHPGCLSLGLSGHVGRVVDVRFRGQSGHGLRMA